MTKSNYHLKKSIKSLESTLAEYRKLVSKRNSEIRDLQRQLSYFQDQCDILNADLNDAHQITAEYKEEHEAEVQDLLDQIGTLEKVKENQQLSIFSSGTYTASVRELYYIILFCH